YARYDIAGDKIDDGYPLSIADNWPGMRDAGFADSIDAAVFLGNGKVFFFKGDKYLRYDVNADKVDSGYPLAIADNWPGMGEAGFADSIDVAVNWGNGKVFFFKGDKYARYDIATGKVEQGYPLPIADEWPGLKEAGIIGRIHAAIDLMPSGELWL